VTPAVLILFFSALLSLAAQGVLRLQGSVVDEDGKPVAGLEISIRHPGQEAFLTHTDAAGLFEYAADTAGEYRLSLNKAGFFRVTDRPLELRDGVNQITFTVNHETEIHEEVQVYSSGEDIQPLDSSHADSLIAREIRDIPVQSTHDLRNSLEVLPEVVRDNSGQLHIAGGRATETQYLLDGFDIGDPVTGNLTVRVNVDSVRSAQVESGRFGAQYGNAGAGVLALDTAVGDDRWRAGATNFVPGVSAENGGIHITSWYPRLTLSGPLRKGRAWFSEALSIQRTLSLVDNLPNNEDSVTQWAGDSMLRTQVKLTPKNLLQGSFLYNQSKASNIGLGPFSPISTTRGLQAYRSFVSVKEQVWSGRTFYEIGLAADFSHSDSRPHGTQPYQLYPNGSAGNYFESMQQKNRRWQAVGSISMPGRRWHGNHDLQFGFSASALQWSRSAQRTAIEVLRADQTVLRQTGFIGPASFSLGDTLAGVYAHDVWRIINPVVLDLGIRADWDRIIQSSMASPRIAINILPLKNNRAKFTAAWGIFLQPVPLSSLGPAHDQQRSDLFFGLPPMPQVMGPVISRFTLPQESLKQPRFYSLSLGWEQTVGRHSQVGFNFTQRDGRLGMAYEWMPLSRDESLFVLRNSRRDHYRSVQVSLRHSFTDKIAMSGSYTHSTSHTNKVFDYSLDTVVFSRQQPGPMDWDVPNRLISSGWAPVPFWGLFLSCFFEYRTGFPFSILNEQQQVVGLANRGRFPDYLSLNFGIEKRIHLFTRDWSIRLTILNVTSHRNADSVNSNIDSPDFLKFSGGQKRAFTARLRLVG
jgi:hypothetical protein